MENEGEVGGRVARGPFLMCYHSQFYCFTSHLPGQKLDPAELEERKWSELRSEKTRFRQENSR